MQGDVDLARAEYGSLLDLSNDSDNNNSDGEETDKGKGKGDTDTVLDRHDSLRNASICFANIRYLLS